MSQLLRVQNLFLSKDGFGAGAEQSLNEPFGHAVPSSGEDVSLPADLASWAFSTASFPGPSNGEKTYGLDDYFTRDFSNNIGAEIMGRNKFGPQRGPWENEDWKGWWGDVPPFHTPVFVLTHHLRPSFTLADTTFHFIDATPSEALKQAKDAAEGKDVRLGGGVTTIKEFLEADLVDTLHVAVAPIEIGQGEKLWNSHEELLDRFHLESVSSPSGVTHLIFWRK